MRTPEEIIRAMVAEGHSQEPYYVTPEEMSLIRQSSQMKNWMLGSIVTACGRQIMVRP